MKIFQLIDWLTKLFKLNNKSKIILLILLPLPILSQNNAAFWLGKRALTTVNVEYVVIAGGGGSANTSSGGLTYSVGGGGAGGYRSSVLGENSGGGASSEASLNLPLNTDFLLTIGAGGGISQNGSNSSFHTITSIGGGAGATSGAGLDGGSGGGGTINYNTGGAGTINQGFSGGSAGGVTTFPNYGTGGGGGGAGSIGLNGVNGSGSGGAGGSGVTSNITGSSITRAIGGSGGTTIYGDANGIAGAPNTGNGATGSALVAGGTTSGASGGSGVVIIRIPSTANNVLIGSGLQYKDSSGVTQNGNGTRVAPSYTPSGYKVYEFVGGTGNIQF